MAQEPKKISEFRELQTAQNGDILPIVSGGETKKITKENLLKEIVALVNKKFNTTFELEDWVLNEDNYELVIEHNLDSLSLVSEIRESNDTIYPNRVTVIDNNSVLLSVPATPDCRFSGSVAMNSS